MAVLVQPGIKLAWFMLFGFFSLLLRLVSDLAAVTTHSGQLSVSFRRRQDKTGKLASTD